MFSGKNGKRSMILFLVASFVAAVSFAIGWRSPALAESGGLDEYLVNGTSAYEFYENSNYDERQTVLGLLDEAEALGADYYAKLEDCYADGAPLGDMFQALSAYAALTAKVEECNGAMAAREMSVSVREEFSYRDENLRDVPRATDITALVKGEAKAALASSAEGWDDATGYDFPVSYKVYSGQTEIFAVFTSTDEGEEVIALAEGYRYIENLGGAKGGVLYMVIEDGGEIYTIVISLITETSKDNATLGREKVVTDVEIKGIYSGATTEGQTLDGRYTVALDLNYMEGAEPVKALLSSANADIEAAAPAMVESEYDKYSELIASKIEKVREVAQGKLDAAKQKLAAERDLYSPEALAALDLAYENGTGAIASATTGAALTTALETALEAYKGAVTLPEQFKANYSDLIVPDKYFEYSDDETSDFGRALAATAEINSYNEKVKAALEQEAELLLANLKISAKKAIAEMVKGLDLSAYSDNQLRTIQAQRLEAEQAVDAATLATVSGLGSALDGFADFVGSLGTNSAFGTVPSLESNGIKVEGKFDKAAVLSASLDDADAAKDAAARFDENKKNNLKTRKLTVLDVYEISVSVGGTALTYNGGSTFTVTAPLTEATLNKFKISGIDPESLLVVYVDKDGNVEIHEATLYLNKSGTKEEYKGGNVDWNQITGGSIMFDTQHFSSYSLMGNTSNLALAKVSNLLAGLGESDIPMYLGIGVAAVVAVIGLFLLISLICSAAKRYKIKFVTNGGTKVKRIKKKYGKKLPEFKTPVKDGHVFTGWYIDQTCRYRFIGNTMPRANTVLFAGWMTEEEYANSLVENKSANENTSRLIAFYDKLRAKLASCKKPESNARAFVEKEVLAKLYIENDDIKLSLKTKPACVKLYNGKYYIVNENEKFETLEVIDELTLEEALESIEKMAKANGLVLTEPHEYAPSTAEEAANGYVYCVKYDTVEDFDGRFRALREYGRSFLGVPGMVQPGKLLFELLPNGKESLTLGLAVSRPEMFAEILEAKHTDGKLGFVYEISDGDQMGVAMALIALVLKENGLVYGTPAERDDDFDTTHAYSYSIAGEAAAQTEEEHEEPEEEHEEPAEEIPADENAFDDMGLEDIPFDATPVEEETPAEEIPAEEIPAEETPAEETPAEETPAEETPAPAAEIMEELPLDLLFKKYRLYVRAFGLYLEGNEEPDRTYDGRVILHAALCKNEIATTLDPEGDAEVLTFNSVADFKDIKDKVAAVMEKYGLTYGAEGNIQDLATDIDAFDYKLKFPPEPSAEELLGSLRTYVNSFALFASARPAASLDGTVIVKVALKDGVIHVALDPDGDLQELTVSTSRQLAAAKEAVAEVMAKYGLAVDPTYVPAKGAEGTTFGYRIKF